MRQIKEPLNPLIPIMVRQAHHERDQQLTVRPELVEGLDQRFLKSRQPLKLEPVTTSHLPGALDLLTALGQGENGFGGTPVGDDPGRLDEWLAYCVHLSTAPALSDDFLPQHNYWIRDAAGHVVGLIRMNPRINAQLLERGGHLGYYIAPAFRNRGYGKDCLRLALEDLRTKDVERALVTVESSNTVSLRLVASLGGRLEDERVDAETGCAYRRFWLETGVVGRASARQAAARPCLSAPSPPAAAQTPGRPHPPGADG